jgi:hypothetical protein
LGHDLWICPYDLCWTIGSNASGKLKKNLKRNFDTLKLNFGLGIGSASEMFCRDYQHWLCCL